MVNRNTDSSNLLCPLVPKFGNGKGRDLVGVLLGEFELEQGEEFYSNTFCIKATSADS